MPTSPAPTSPRIAALVYNPIKVDIHALRSRIGAHQDEAGWGGTRYYETSIEDAGQGITRLALEQGADVVMVAGGDGTVRAVAEAMRGSHVPLGLLPSGTGNVLARNLAVPLDLERAIRTVFTGDDHAIDVGVIELTRVDGSVDEAVFAVMAGFGIDAKMIANTRSDLKRRVGWLAYVDGIARSLGQLEPVKLRFRLDGSAERPLTAHSVIIGNCGNLPGGLLLIPDAEPDDGRLDVVALRPQHWFDWIAVWRQLFWENGVLRRSAVGRRIIDLAHDVRSVTYVTGETFGARLEEPQEVQLDGEEFGQAVDLHAHVDVGSLIVKVRTGSTVRTPHAVPAAARGSA